ncbi:MAG: branched-chain amino acid ABC transporter permease [Dehalococcoidia bacterium]
MNSRKWAKPLSYTVLVVFLFLIPLFITGPYQLHILIMAGIGIILASSVRLVVTSGLLSLAHGGMMAIGAYTAALLVMKLELSSWAALVLAGVAAANIALLVGYPFVRLKGMYFALVTVFLGEVIRLIAEQWRSLTGGTVGIFNIPRPDPIAIPGLLNMDFASKVDFYYFMLVLMLVILFILYALEHSRIGLTWFSIAQADFLAESVGVNTARYQVLAFTIGAFFAGIAGAFYSQYIGAINPRAFGFFWSVYIVIYMIVGGMKSFAGPIIGALVLTYLPESARVLKEFQPFVFAGILMLVIFLLPDGLVSLPQRLRKLLRGKV